MESVASCGAIDMALLTECVILARSRAINMALLAECATGSSVTLYKHGYKHGTPSGVRDGRFGRAINFALLTECTLARLVRERDPFTMVPRSEHKGLLI